jgi:hypothetical protein
MKNCVVLTCLGAAASLGTWPTSSCQFVDQDCANFTTSQADAIAGNFSGNHVIVNQYFAAIVPEGGNNSCDSAPLTAPVLGYAIEAMVGVCLPKFKYKGFNATTGKPIRERSNGYAMTTLNGTCGGHNTVATEWQFNDSSCEHMDPPEATGGTYSLKRKSYFPPAGNRGSRSDSPYDLAQCTGGSNYVAGCNCHTDKAGEGMAISSKMICNSLDAAQATSLNQQIKDTGELTDSDRLAIAQGLVPPSTLPPPTAAPTAAPTTGGQASGAHQSALSCATTLVVAAAAFTMMHK